MTNDISPLEAQIQPVLQEAQQKLSPEAAMNLETFVSVSLHVLRKTHPKHIRDAARLVEIQARIKGRPVL